MGVGLCLLIVLNLIAWSMGHLKIQEASGIREYTLNYDETKMQDMVRSAQLFFEEQ
jgi:hypothetical protein